MARKEWTEAEQQTARSMAASGDSDAAIGKVLGRNPKSVGLWRQRNGIRGGRLVREEKAPPKKEPPPPDEFSRDNKGDTEYLHSKSTRIRTLDELLAAAAVDLTVWEVERFVVNKWESAARLGAGEDARIETAPLYQVKAWLRRKRGLNAEDVRAALVADLKAHAPIYPAMRLVQPRTGQDGHLLELCVFDPHFGKYAWAEETGEDYDIGIAADRFLWAVEKLIGQARGFPIERIVFPVGNDAIHADNLQGTTTAGTRQDVDSRWFKVFRTARLVYQRAIDRCMEIAPVDLVVVPGNHDQQSALALGEVLDAQYSRTDRVTVQGGPKPRKYYAYGKCLIQYQHGHQQKPADMASVMPVEEPHLWAASEFREVHHGHHHRKKETQFVGVEEHKGVRVRGISSLSSTDAWHSEQGFVHAWKAAEGYIWHPKEGLVGNVSANLGPYQKRVIRVRAA